MRKKVTLKQISQWQYVDKTGTQRISPKYRVLASLIREMYPENFFTKKSLTIEQGRNLQTQMETLYGFHFDTQNACQIYGTTFLIHNWRGWKTKEYTTCRKELTQLYSLLK
jgi:hypothetical protein